MSPTIKRTIANTVIDPESNKLYKAWHLAQKLADERKRELLTHMASLPEGHTSAYCSYVQSIPIPDSENLKYLAKCEDLSIPFTTGRTYKYAIFIKELKGRVDYEDLREKYSLTKAKAGYIVKGRTDE